MKTLRYRYELKIAFDTPVTDHSFTVRCIPHSDERQRIVQQNIQILPKEFLCENTDAFGNSTIFGRAKEQHRSFEVVSEGVAQTGLSDGTNAKQAYQLGLFLQQTAHTAPGEGLRHFFETLPLQEEPDAYMRALLIMNRLRENFVYEQGCTDITTTAEQAWKLGRGVCQDYAHIMLSLCRMAGITCRYVAGMLTGEGYSHAWIEIAKDGRWYGIDPTNGVIVLENHIKISHGRDYSDCLINQGIFTGNAKQEQSIFVRVENASEERKL